MFDAKIVQIAQKHKNWTALSAILHGAGRQNRVQNRDFFRKNIDGDPTKITKISRKIDELQAIAEKQWFSASERLRPWTRDNSAQELKNGDFWRENRPDRPKSFKMNGVLNESLRVHAQKSAQNRDFSENPR